MKEHATSHYPLEGKHAAVACDKCHTPAGKDTVYKVKFAACTDCHQDAHDKQFAAAPYQNRCEDCHTVKDFHRSTFTIAKHKNTRFVLTGAHVAVACADCHKAGLGGRTDKILPFHFEDSTCTACHTDPHKGEFKERMAQKRADGTALGCEACHNTRSWIDIRSFDHSKTKFALLGAHRVVACGECHKALPGTHEIQFKGTPKNCEACHTDPHGGQFAAKDGITKCGDCHVDQRWAPSTFDHDKRTQFPLTGGARKCGLPDVPRVAARGPGQTGFVLQTHAKKLRGLPWGGCPAALEAVESRKESGKATKRRNRCFKYTNTAAFALRGRRLQDVEWQKYRSKFWPWAQ